MTNLESKKTKHKNFLTNTEVNILSAFNSGLSYRQISKMFKTTISSISGFIQGVRNNPKLGHHITRKPNVESPKGASKPSKDSNSRPKFDPSKIEPGMSREEIRKVLAEDPRYKK